jgi:hypothetical protein
MIAVKPLAEINREAIRILIKEIGIADTLRFIGQFTTGYGNYTEERQQLFAGQSLDDILVEMKRENPTSE